MGNYLYILAGDERFKEKLEDAGIRTSKIDLVMVEADSKEASCIRNGLKKVINKQNSLKDGDKN